MQPKVYSVSDHEINSQLIDPDALYILKKLREAGFIAYLVGGSVRDLLINKTPKDFDISTSARPEQIKALFTKNCILIGRRFRLAHVRFGHKIIEVSTFRSGDNESDLILQDNQWGTPEEDVLRRDFTVNGLFYDARDHSIIDFVGGWEDLKKNILRSIGDAEARFKQDPVRMIRLLKFRARFGFQIDPQARNALLKCREEILKSSEARILEEILRMLESGASAPFINLLKESGLLKLLFNKLFSFLSDEKGKELMLLLTAADKINLIDRKKTMDRSILGACLLYPLLKQEIQLQYLEKNSMPHMGDIILSTGSIIKNFEIDSFTHFPRRLTAEIASILSTQYRLTPLSGKRHHHPKILRHKDFASSLEFLKLRAMVDKSLIEVYQSWKESYKQYERQSRRNHHQHHHTHTAQQHHTKTHSHTS